jgi:hypothetical protein
MERERERKKRKSKRKREKMDSSCLSDCADTWQFCASQSAIPISPQRKAEIISCRKISKKNWVFQRRRKRIGRMNTAKRERERKRERKRKKERKGKRERHTHRERDYLHIHESEEMTM